MLFSKLSLRVWRLKISKLQSNFLFVAKPAVVWIVYIEVYAVTQRVRTQLYSFNNRKKLELVLGLEYLG